MWISVNLVNVNLGGQVLCNNWWFLSEHFALKMLVHFFGLNSIFDILEPPPSKNTSLVWCLKHICLSLSLLHDMASIEIIETIEPMQKVLENSCQSCKKVTIFGKNIHLEKFHPYDRKLKEIFHISSCKIGGT